MFIKLSISLSLFALSLQSLATNYERGYIICENFEEWERLYKNNPDDMGLHWYYASCLLAKGDSDKEALRHMRDLEERGFFLGAYTISDYLLTEGSFNEVTENEYYRDKGIKALDRALSLIAADERQAFLEFESRRYEIYAHYRRVDFLVTRFINLYRRERDKDGYPASLFDDADKLFSYGKECHNLPPNLYYDPDLSEQYIKYCGFVMELARSFKSLGEDLLRLKADEKLNKDKEGFFLSLFKDDDDDDFDELKDNLEDKIWELVDQFLTDRKKIEKEVYNIHARKHLQAVLPAQP